jgi:ribosomal protein S16
MREASISSLTSEETTDFFGKGARLLDRVKKLGWRTNELRSQLPVQANEE